MKSRIMWMSREWKSILGNPKWWVPLFGILLIPVLYSGSYLWAFWDPYGRLSDLPVAIVNEDSGAVHNGKAYHLGNDLVDELKKDAQFQWHFVTKSEAIEGLKQNNFYIIIEVPRNFSERAATIASDNPEPLQLLYTANQGYNYIASRIGESGVTKIREGISRNLIKSYTKELFITVNKSIVDLKKASDGAAKIKDGADKLGSGLVELSKGMNDQVPQLSSLVDGVDQITDKLRDLSKGATALADGANGLQVGFMSAQSGANQLVGGLQKSVSGFTQIEQGMNDFGGGLSQSAAGASKLNSGRSQINQGISQLAIGSSGLNKLLKAYAVKHADAAKDSDYQALLTASSRLNTGILQLQKGSGAFGSSFNALNSGIQTLEDRYGALQTGVIQLGSGQGALLQGAEQLNIGLGEFNSGVVSLHNGLKDLQSGALNLQSGSVQVGEGMRKLASGWNEVTSHLTQLEQGERTLSSGAGELASRLNEGTKRADELHGGQQLYDTVANPVRVQENNYNEVPNYGTALTPFFLSLSLYVGAMLLSSVFPIRAALQSPPSPLSWFISKFAVISLVGVIQSLLACLFLFKGLHLETVNTGDFILFAIMTSITYMSLVQFFVTAFDNIGRFIGIIILVLQLTSSAGTYPLELVPVILQQIHPYLPMTYTVNGFRTLISSGNYSFLREDAGILALFTIGFMLATWVSLIYFYRKEKHVHGLDPMEIV